jgi:hypothetical protein
MIGYDQSYSLSECGLSDSGIKGCDDKKPEVSNPPLQ